MFHFVFWFSVKWNISTLISLLFQEQILWVKTGVCHTSFVSSAIMSDLVRPRLWKVNEAQQSYYQTMTYIDIYINTSAYQHTSLWFCAEHMLCGVYVCRKVGKWPRQTVFCSVGKWKLLILYSCADFCVGLMAVGPSSKGADGPSCCCFCCCLCGRGGPQRGPVQGTVCPVVHGHSSPPHPPEWRFPRLVPGFHQQKVNITNMSQIRLCICRCGCTR